MMIDIATPALERTVERRAFSRLQNLIPIRYKIINEKNPDIMSQMLEGATKNISHGGLCLETNVVRSNGLHISHDSSMLYKNIIELEIDITTSTTVTVRGDVLWYNLSDTQKSKYKFEVGIVFHKVSSDDYNKLKDYLHSTH